MNYAEYLEQKTQVGGNHGFHPNFMPDAMFDFQRALTTWAVRKGRAAIFADCGLGKTLMQLAWAQNVADKTGKPTLILTPLAVAQQTVEEGAKFGIDVIRSVDGTAHGQITVTNYEQLHKFTTADFGGVVCDESSILKNFDGARKSEITQFMRKHKYRLLATATAAPNDYIELGTSSEALGEMGHIDMLGRFFTNNLNNVAIKRLYGEVPQWRLKGHSPIPFWQWVSSWSRACRRPSDIGFDDAGFDLPELIETEHVIDSRSAPNGMLFALPACNLIEQRDETKRTVLERCEAAAALVNNTGQPALIMCSRNDEGDMLVSLIPDAIQISGKDSDESKEDKFGAFKSGSARILITKPKIGAWGLNFQHCAHVVYFPTHSYEQYYQAVRRCWRFGQERPVHVDLILTEGQVRVMANLRRKAGQADEMFSALVEHMNNAQSIKSTNNHTKEEVKPSWL